MPKMLTNAQSYVQFRESFKGTNTIAGVLREAADFVESIGPADLLNVNGGIAVSEDDPAGCYWELELYFDDHGHLASETKREDAAGWDCAKCGHRHEGRALAYICIGCVCLEKPAEGE